MKNRRPRPNRVIRMLAGGDKLLAQGKTVEEVAPISRSPSRPSIVGATSTAASRSSSVRTPTMARRPNQGTEVNTARINAALNSAKPTVNTATCSISLSPTPPVTVLDGTAFYAGVTGPLSFTSTFAATGPRYMSGSHNGQCNPKSGTQSRQRGQSLGHRGLCAYECSLGRDPQSRNEGLAERSAKHGETSNAAPASSARMDVLVMVSP